MIKKIRAGLVFPFLLVLLFSADLSAQKVSNFSTFRNFETEAYFRINYDNDYFSHSDDNYTQGVSFEFIAPLFDRNPLNFLFINTTGKSRHGLAIEHISFTPPVISSPHIQLDERPFSASLYLKLFRSTDRPETGSRFNSSLSLGVIGPIAYGEEGQVFIHEATGNWIPKGWSNQISNDLLLNYNLRHERSIIDLMDLIFLNSDLGIRAGTMYTDAHIGFSNILGLFNSPLNADSAKRAFQLYIYQNPRIYLVGYDATLQGGLFSESVYTIAADDVTRIKAQWDYGLVVKYKFVYLEYTKSVITKEFNTGQTEGWGGLRIGLKI